MNVDGSQDALRVKIWRRLQQIGAVAIKQSVYVMPFSGQSREDLSWTLKEIIGGGGNGSISELRFVEGLTDDQIVSQFQNARKADYKRIIQDANRLMAQRSTGKIGNRDPAAKAHTKVNKLRRRLAEVTAIDFFPTAEQGTADLLIKDLAAQLTRSGPQPASADDMDEGLQGRIWVTRKNLFVDRIACAWLIRRFVDGSAVFKYVDAETYEPKADELRFDMFDGEYTHEDDRCTFEVMIQRFRLKDRGLKAVAQVVHDIDLKDDKYGLVETEGLQAPLTGLAASQSDDDARLTMGIPLFDNLYAYYSRQKVI